MKKAWWEINCIKCEYFCGQKDENGDIVLTFCNNKENKDDCEGNTNEKSCPLNK